MGMSLTKYVHLSLLERERLFGLLKQGKSLRNIGKILGRSHTSLAREIKRNSKYGRAYIPCKAQARYERVAKRQRRRCPLKNPGVYLYVRENLRKGFSPEAIAGRLPLDVIGESITPETIYQYIYETGKRKKQFTSRLTRSHSKRKKHTGRSVQKTPRIPFAKSIDSRPEKINTRQKIGHWETDLMEGSRGTGKALSVMVERKSRYVTLEIVNNKTAKEKDRSVADALNVFPRRLVRSITIDNGSENTGCDTWGLPVYRCNPYHSWEKGSVENVIGRIRRYIPKGTDLTGYSNNDIKRLENLLNNTPRKCLNFLTPKESLLQFLNYKSTYKPKWCTSK
jgi:IS30 family transposase